ncbi:MAG: hypothetical protein UHS49_01075 [Faecalimonas sp.]|nr:hypothetical protein [Faecalimonas sp.]
MTTVDSNFLEFAEKELVVCVMRFANGIGESKASQIAKEIIEKIDWNNSALMHKGLSWMAKNYLTSQKLV